MSITAGLPSLLFGHYREPGELDSLIAYMIENFNCDLLRGVGYGFDKLLLAEAHLERCEMEKARFYAEQAITKAWLKEQFYIVACAHFLLARVSVFEGDGDAALAHLESIKFDIPRRLSFTMPPDIARTYTAFGDMCEAVLLCTIQRNGRIPSSLANLSTFTQLYIFRGMGIVELVRIKLKLLNGEYAEAEVLCDYYEKEFTRYPSQLGRLRVMVYRAVINQQLHGPESAQEVLGRALEEAARDGIVLPFSDNADTVLPLLQNLSPNPRLSDDYLHAVRQACRRFSANLKRVKARESTGVLSPREAEVFHLLAEGKSQKNIAASLNISISTVKRHLESIYSKLGVNNRVAALNKGFTLGL